jgi:hypothetical protein
MQLFIKVTNAKSKLICQTLTKFIRRSFLYDVYNIIIYNQNLILEIMYIFKKEQEQF